MERIRERLRLPGTRALPSIAEPRDRGLKTICATQNFEIRLQY